MASTPTTNLSYNKPAISDRGWGTTMNANLDAIDTDVGTEHKDGGAHGPQVNIAQDSDAAVLTVDQPSGGATADLIEITNSGSGFPIATDAGGTLGSTGARLTSGGVWTDGTCYRDTKIVVEEIEATSDWLDRVARMPIARWIPANKPNDTPVLGPFQDELVDSFGLNPEGVAPKEIAAVALVAIQALKQEVDNLKQEVHDLRAKLGE